MMTGQRETLRRGIWGGITRTRDGSRERDGMDEYQWRSDLWREEEERESGEGGWLDLIRSSIAPALGMADSAHAQVR